MGQGGRGLGSAPRRGRPSLLYGRGDWWKARRVALQSRRGHRAAAQPPLALGTMDQGASEPTEARGSSLLCGAPRDPDTGAERETKAAGSPTWRHPSFYGGMWGITLLPARRFRTPAPAPEEAAERRRDF